jgi:bacteriorhodopsin
MEKFYHALFAYFTVSSALGILYMIWKTWILDGQYHKDPYLRRDWYYFVLIGWLITIPLILITLVAIVVDDIKKIKWK